jgi:hypothetical protein
MTRHKKTKREPTLPANDADRAEDAPVVTGAALIKVMQDPRVRDLEFEYPGVRSRIRRVKL